MELFYIHVAVQIKPPDNNYLKNYSKEKTEKFMFDLPNRFTLFRKKGEEKEVLLAIDDCRNWFLMTYFTSDSLSGLKWARQTAKPSYLKSGQELPLVDLLESEGLCVEGEEFDKAMAHSSILVKSLSAFTSEKQARIANVDGEDDPAVVHNIHFVENIFENHKTRYIAGAETFSFATVTENQGYFHDIHLKNSAFLYLQYFVYYQKHGVTPSYQMVPRLLGNLWGSKKVFCTDWNPSLFRVEQIGQKHNSAGFLAL